MEITTGRPAAVAPKAMVVAPHSLASAAGVDILRAGGSAIDAAIAASAVLAVVYPHMTSIGGDAFWLIHDAKRGRVRYLNGGGRAATGATMQHVRALGHDEIPLRGILPATLTTPGAVASWSMAHDEYGRLPLTRILASAIGYARDGFVVTQRLAELSKTAQADLAQHRESADIFLRNGEFPAAGSLLVNKNLARTLEVYARDGWRGFYEGEIAAEMIGFSEQNGGLFTPEDFAAQTARWGEPLVGTYRDVTIYNTPAPTQGFTLLEMLNLLEPLALRELPMFSPERLHLLVQAKQIAFHDRDQLLGDPDFAPVPMDELISNTYANKRARLLSPDWPLPWDEVPSFGSLSGDTVYIAVVDEDGNAVSLIQSLYSIYGSAMVAGDTGIVLQNRGAYFSLDAGHPNKLEPGKIPVHTLMASIAMRDDGFWGAFGCMGADGQPQIQLQCYLAMIDYGLDIQQAVEMPRFLSGRFGLGDARETLHMEARFPPETIADLAALGHLVERWEEWNQLAGHAHGVFIDRETGNRIGGADPRSDGAAIGF
ncbi:MAG: gamma-glutamyltransferase [Alphaproteobacteria bacterium]